MVSGTPGTPAVTSLPLFAASGAPGKDLPPGFEPVMVRDARAGTGAFRVRILKPRRIGPVRPEIRHYAQLVFPAHPAIDHPAVISGQPVTSMPVVPALSAIRNLSPLQLSGSGSIDPVLSTSTLNLSRHHAGRNEARTEPVEAVSPEVLSAAPAEGSVSLPAACSFDCEVRRIEMATCRLLVSGVEPGFPSIGRARDGMYVVSGLPVTLRRTSRKRLPGKTIDAIDRAIPLRSGFELHEIEIVAVFIDIPINRVMKLEMSEDFKSLQIHPAPRARAWGEPQTLVFFREIASREIHRIFV